MELLQRQLVDAKSKISAQSQRIQLLQDRSSLAAQPIKAVTTEPTPGTSGRIWPMKDQSKTTPAPLSARYLGDTIAFKNKRSNTSPYHGRSRRQGELAASEMRPSSATKRAMVSALEKDGYEMVSEETALHLWKMKEQAKEELKRKETVSETIETRINCFGAAFARAQ